MCLQLKGIIAADPQNLQMKERFLAGSMAGAVSQSATYPVEVGQFDQTFSFCLIVSKYLL